jgi:hypothetical protein
MDRHDIPLLLANGVNTKWCPDINSLIERQLCLNLIYIFSYKNYVQTNFITENNELVQPVKYYENNKSVMIIHLYLGSYSNPNAT